MRLALRHRHDDDDQNAAIAALARRDAAAGEPVPGRAPSRYEELAAALHADVLRQHAAYVETISELDDRRFRLDAELRVDDSILLGTPAARAATERAAKEAELVSLGHRRANAHRVLLDDVESRRKATAALAEAYRAAHGAHRRDGAPPAPEPPDFVLDLTSLGEIPDPLA